MAVVLAIVTAVLAIVTVVLAIVTVVLAIVTAVLAIVTVVLVVLARAACDGARCLEPANSRSSIDEHVVGAHVVVGRKAGRARRDAVLTFTHELSVVVSARGGRGGGLRAVHAAAAHAAAVHGGRGRAAHASAGLATAVHAVANAGSGRGGRI